MASTNKPNKDQCKFTDGHVPLVVLNGEQPRGHSDVATRVHKKIPLKAHLRERVLRILSIIWAKCSALYTGWYYLIWQSPNDAMC